jgi:glyoxylase-like metal-dependent hydrolase (beta-lactamase superfamily II)
MSASVKSFFDPVTATITHVVHDGPSSACAIVDPVLDYDRASGRTATASADRVLSYVRDKDLQVEWILETHVHADHLSAAAYLKGRCGARVGIGEHVLAVQRVFQPIFNLEPQFRPDGSQFDRLFADGEAFALGRLSVEVMHVPGHTPACVAYRVGDRVFVGDTIFRPDVGSARCDFPGGDSQRLYRSARRLLSLPDETRLYLCHDYPPRGRKLRFVATVAEQRRGNIHLRDSIGQDEFVALRTRRDANLPMPELILPSIQVNIRAGALPPAESNGVRYLKIPLDTL